MGECRCASTESASVGRVDAERQLQALGCWVHGVLAGLHLLGVAYNLKRRNWVDVTAHSLAAGYDVWATTKHVRKLRND